jgi:hypothetical protein
LSPESESRLLEPQRVIYSRPKSLGSAAARIRMLLATEPIVVEDYSESEALVEETEEEVDEELQRIYVIAGRRYVREDAVTTSIKGSKTKTSMIWKGGFTLIDELDPLIKKYYCKQCRDVEKRRDVTLFSANSGTRAILDHWKSVHKIDKDGSAIIANNSIASVLATKQASTSTSKDSLVGSLVWIASFELFKALLIRWFVFSHIAY